LQFGALDLAKKLLTELGKHMDVHRPRNLILPILRPVLYLGKVGSQVVIGKCMPLNLGKVARFSRAFRFCGSVPVVSFAFEGTGVYPVR
jgi:hypothetical protein